jgi:cobalt-zinc-cadmium resistance protein CzcA
VQKPLALVVVGGMTLAPVLILLVLPLLIGRFSIHVPNQFAVAHGADERDLPGHHHQEHDEGEAPA